MMALDQMEAKTKYNSNVAEFWRECRRIFGISERLQSPGKTGGIRDNLQYSSQRGPFCYCQTRCHMDRAYNEKTKTVAFQMPILMIHVS